MRGVLVTASRVEMHWLIQEPAFLHIQESTLKSTVQEHLELIFMQDLSSPGLSFAEVSANARMLKMVVEHCQRIPLSARSPRLEDMSERDPVSLELSTNVLIKTNGASISCLTISPS